VEQNSGVEQINDAIQMLNQVTQQNAAASEEMATVSEELAAQAMQLRNTISFFKLGNEGDFNLEINSRKKPNRYIEQPKSFASNSRSRNEGFNLDLSKGDKLDNDFETF
jgi:methyl-accepting chemotaxis protein